MAENYKHLYEQTKKMLAMYQDELIPGFRKQIEELEATVVHQRKRADTAETFVCTMCAECEWEVNDGILVMQKACCSWFPECEKFKLRPGWIPVTERLPEVGSRVVACGEKGGVFIVKAEGKTTGFGRMDGASKYRSFTHWMPLPEPPKEANDED
jgi:hypothetical protein